LRKGFDFRDAIKSRSRKRSESGQPDASALERKEVGKEDQTHKREEEIRKAKRVPIGILFAVSNLCGRRRYGGSSSSS
jgi:hypothetical protein